MVTQLKAHWIILNKFYLEINTNTFHAYLRFSTYIADISFFQNVIFIDCMAIFNFEHMLKKKKEGNFFKEVLIILHFLVDLKLLVISSIREIQLCDDITYNEASIEPFLFLLKRFIVVTVAEIFFDTLIILFFSFTFQVFSSRKTI